MTAAEPSVLLTVQELADEWHLSPATFYSWRKRGYGPKSFRLGGRVVYSRAEVQEWMAAQEQATARGGAA